MISNGIYDAFCNTESVCVILISNHANDVYRKLQLFSKLYHKQNEQKQIIYFTLNANDYMHKYKMLFNHERIQKNSAFIGSNRRKEDEENVTSFYDETKQIPDMKHIKSNVKCCCILITLYLYMQHSAQYATFWHGNGISNLWSEHVIYTVDWIVMCR
eukprot:1076824_1